MQSDAPGPKHAPSPRLHGNAGLRGADAARQRKALYQEEHPETKRGSGGGRAKAGKGAKSQNATEQTPAFIDAHAKQTGRHRATT